MMESTTTVTNNNNENERTTIRRKTSASYIADIIQNILENDEIASGSSATLFTPDQNTIQISSDENQYTLNGDFDFEITDLVSNLYIDVDELPDFGGDVAHKHLVCVCDKRYFSLTLCSKCFLVQKMRKTTNNNEEACSSNVQSLGSVCDCEASKRGEPICGNCFLVREKLISGGKRKRNSLNNEQSKNVAENCWQKKRKIPVQNCAESAVDLQEERFVDAFCL